MAEPWLLATPRWVLRAGPGTPVVVQAGAGQLGRLARAAAQRLAGAPDGHVVTGAIPYDEQTPAALTLAAVSVSPRRNRPQAGPTVPPSSSAAPAADQAYVAAVAQVVRRLQAGTAEKVVLARHVDLAGPRAEDTSDVADRLMERYPSAYVFRVELPSPAGQRRVLLGASPELLLTRRGNRVVLNPLAGSAPRHPHPVRDRAHPRALLLSAKDRREHQLVTEELAQRLGPLCSRLQVPARPAVKPAGPLWHLSTLVRARLRHPAPPLSNSPHCSTPRQLSAVSRGQRHVS